MRLVLDSDVLVHALRIPKRADLYVLHEKASNLFGMDVFVLTYAVLKDAVLITNDWALWYVAWKPKIFKRVKVKLNY